ncbi:hypothetical protein GCM10020218_007330 [Dactylosporangium vinaceum]
MQARAAEPGAEGTRLDDVHADAERGDLGVEGSEMASSANFAAQYAPKGRHRQLPAHRRDLHDRAPARPAGRVRADGARSARLSGPHVRQDGAGQRHRAEEHDVHEGPQVLGLDLLDGAHRPVAGVVHEHVDRAEPVERLRDRGR